MNLSPLLALDGYKLDHRSQYPEGTSLVYSNLTPRSSRLAGVDEVVMAGTQGELVDIFIDGQLMRFDNLVDIRKRLEAQL